MSPLKQFEIYSLIKLPTLFGQSIDFTNASLYMLISVLFACIFLWLGIRRAAVVPSFFGSLVEIICGFVSDIITGSCGKEGLKYSGLILTVFFFIMSCNLTGMLPLPMSFTVTSHIIVTFAVALLIFLFVTFVGFKKQGLRFLGILLPQGTPWWLAPLMVMLEFCTYIFRPVSLSIRLTANMIAGHTILKVISGFVIPVSPLVSPLSFLFVVILIIFEVFIAILQAYIFTILTCVYLNDSLIKH